MKISNISRSISNKISRNISHKPHEAPTALLGSTSNTGDILTQTIFAPTGWNDGWKAAKAAKASTPATIMVIGDSISTGSIAGTTPFADGWVTQMRDNLCGVDLAGLASEYIPSIMRIASGSYFNFTDHKWAVLAGTPTFLDTVGWHPSEWWTNTATWLLRFTAPYACVDSNLYVWTQSGTSQWRKNGGSGNTITNSTTYEIKKVNIGSLAQGDTIDWGQQSTSQAAVPMGIELIKASGGISVSRFCSGSAKLSTHVQPGSTRYPDDSTALLTNSLCAAMWGGRMPRSGSTFSGYTGGFPTQPHLAIIALGVNDLASNVAASSFGEHLDRTCAALRRGRGNCSIIFVIYDYPDQNYSDASTFIRVPAAPSVSVQGTPGATSWRVKYGYETPYGVSVPGTHATIANGPATLSGSNFLRVTMATAPASAVAYRIYASKDGGSTWFLSAPNLTQAAGGVYDLTAESGGVTVPSTDTSAMPNYRNWHQYVEQYYDVAYKYGAAVVNVIPEHGSTPVSQGYMNGIDIHPTTTGHDLIAGLVNSLV